MYVLFVVYVIVCDDCDGAPLSSRHPFSIASADRAPRPRRSSDRGGILACSSLPARLGYTRVALARMLQSPHGNTTCSHKYIN